MGKRRITQDPSRATQGKPPQSSRITQDKIPPKPRKGWTVHNKHGERIGTVTCTYSDNTVGWTADDYGQHVKSTLRWEDSPPGTYRACEVAHRACEVAPRACEVAHRYQPPKGAGFRPKEFIERIRKPFTLTKPKEDHAVNEHFRRVATKRTSNAIAAINSIGRLTASRYEYTNEEANQIVRALTTAVAELETKLKKKVEPENEFTFD